MRFILAGVVSLIFVSNIHAVTAVATASGQFDDGTTWSAVAKWDESAMADLRVRLDEMDSFVTTTQNGPSHATSSYQIGNAVFLGDGFLFDANTVAAVTSISVAPTDHYYDGFDPSTSQTIQIRSSVVRELPTTNPIVRTDFSAPVWRLSIQSSAIPEPVSLTSILCASSLLFRRRRS